MAYRIFNICLLVDIPGNAQKVYDALKPLIITNDVLLDWLLIAESPANQELIRAYLAQRSKDHARTT